MAAAIWKPLPAARLGSSPLQLVVLVNDRSGNQDSFLSPHMIAPRFWSSGEGSMDFDGKLAPKGQDRRSFVLPSAARIKTGYASQETQQDVAAACRRTRQHARALRGPRADWAHFGAAECFTAGLALLCS